MNIATEAIRAEPHVEIGSLLQRDAALIVGRWCNAAHGEQASAQRVHYAVLRDDLPAFLDAMGRALQQSGEPDSEPYRKAREHGAQRWESGWSITELVRDYQLLRLVILEYLEESLDRSLRYREILAVGVFIDDAIATSVSKYTAERDEHLKAVERDRVRALEELDRRKDEFLAILGHELRNPLDPIRNSVSILRHVLKAPHAAVATSLDVLDRQSQQMCRLVDDMLDLARISRGEFELRPQRFDVRSAVEQALQMTEALMTARQHRLATAIPQTPLFVNADPNRIAQIVVNLLNNAAKYTDPHGEISLTVEAAADAVVITVRDNGIGIAPDMLARVFELFARAEQPHGGLDGLGIGLALVQRLVQQHGGTIEAASAGVGRGSVFTVRLPAAVDGDTPLLTIKHLRVDRH